MSRIKVEGVVRIDQPGGGAEAGTNHFVDLGLQGLLSILAHRHIEGGRSSGAGSAPIMRWFLPGSFFNMFIGTDQVTVTTTGMSALVAPIGVGSGTAPNSKTQSAKDGTADGIWETEYTSIWDPGTVAGTIGEAALFTRLPQELAWGWTKFENMIPSGVDDPFIPATVMVSRLSVADTDIAAFLIDTNLSLRIRWTVRLSFA